MLNIMIIISSCRGVQFKTYKRFKPDFFFLLKYVPFRVCSSLKYCLQNCSTYEEIWKNWNKHLTDCFALFFSVEGFFERRRNRRHPCRSSSQAWHDQRRPFQHQRVNRRKPLQGSAIFS